MEEQKNISYEKTENLEFDPDNPRLPADADDLDKKTQENLVSQSINNIEV